MKNFITLLGIIAVGLGLYYLINNKGVVYQNEKFGYEVTLPSGWNTINEASDKDNVNIYNPNLKMNVDISLSPTDPAGFQEIATPEKTVKKIVTKNGYEGFLRIDNTSISKGTVITLRFTSDATLTTNGAGQKPQSIVFLLPGVINESLLMDIVNTFKEI